MAGTSPAIILWHSIKRMPLILAFLRTHGGAPRPPAYLLLKIGFHLTFPHAVPGPIALAGVAPFVFMIALPKRAFGQRHDGEMGGD